MYACICTYIHTVCIYTHTHNTYIYNLLHFKQYWIHSYEVCKHLKITCMKLKEPWIFVRSSSKCCLLNVGSLGKADGMLKTSTGIFISIVCWEPWEVSSATVKIIVCIKNICFFSSFTYRYLFPFGFLLFFLEIECSVETKKETYKFSLWIFTAHCWLWSASDEAMKTI